MRLKILTPSISNAPPNPADGSILVAAVDGQGIPMVKPGGAQPTVRLTKGQKANRKRMATVAAVSTRAPWVRTPEQVVESLFRIQPQPPVDEQIPPRLDAAPDSLTGMPAMSASMGAADSRYPTIFVAIRNLGLSLEPQKEPVKQLIVDFAQIG
jgi:uncharacterized protein (TIGR03435 family)